MRFFLDAKGSILESEKLFSHLSYFFPDNYRRYRLGNMHMLLHTKIGSVAKNLALLQNQQKPSQLGNLSTLIK